MCRVAADYARRVFTLDVRSLALMRIAVAATVLLDLFTRLAHATDHYSDAGVLPRDTARGVSWLADTSLLAVSGSTAWVAIVFAIAIALGFAVLVGWRTRLTTLLLWLVVLTIQHRNPLLWDHRDAMFTCALVCGLLLPWGDAFSLDARRGSGTERYFGVPAAAYVIQIACIYLFAALLKDGAEWRSDFTAVERAISLDYWANPAASVLREHPTVCAVLTAGVLVFEAAVAPLLFVPWIRARWIVVGGLVALQLGFAVFLWLDTFPLIAAAISLGLVPSSLWSRSPAPPVVESSRATNVFALALIAYVIALNVMAFDRDAFAAVRRPAELLGVEQKWTMFAPAPTRLDGWFIVAARERDETIDLLTERPVSWVQPTSFREGIATTRELVYMRRLLVMDDDARDSFAAARCRDGTRSIAVYFFPVDDGRIGLPELLVRRDCR